MQESILYQLDTWLVVTVLFQLMLLFSFIGGQIGFWKRKRLEVKESNDTLVATLFVLLGILIACTFGMASSRFDDRRKLVVEEANAISTALLRTGLYSEEEQEYFREDFKAYIEARISYTDAGRSLAKLTYAQENTQVYGIRIWQRATRLSREPEYAFASAQMIPAVNRMLDLAKLRYMSEQIRLPDSIVSMLFVLSVATAFFAGYAGAIKGRMDWLLLMGIYILFCLVIFITLDLDRPRRGLLKLDTNQRAVLELRKLLDVK